MDRRILLLILLITVQLTTCIAQPVNPDEVMNNIKAWGTAGIKIGVSVALTIVFIISILRGLKGSADYTAGPSFTGEGLREMFSSIKRPVFVVLFLIFLLWLPDILVAIGLLPSAPFTVDWKTIFGK